MEPQSIPKEMADWARTTMVFAMQLRAYENSRPMHDEVQLEKSTSEAEMALREIWDDAVHDCENTDTPGLHSIKFIGEVFSWCSEHRFSR